MQGEGEGPEDQLAREAEIHQQLRHRGSQRASQRGRQPIAQTTECKGFAFQRRITLHHFSWRNVLMVLTDRDITRVTETDEELLIFDVSDDALERAAGVVVDGHAFTMVFGTEIAGPCCCPV
jgi:hypothetical protein